MATEREPRISANKLGEYMVASAARRKGIIRDQKRPPTAMAARYRQADDPVSDFFTHGDASKLHQAAAKLRAQSGGTAWAAGDRASTADAMDAIADMAHDLLAPGLTFALPPDRPRRLALSGVDVSVQPTMLVMGDHRGKPSVGALKLHFIKSEDSALTTKGAEFVATLLHQWVMRFGPSGRQAVPSLSWSVDVFRGAVVPAPASQQRRMADLEAACEEIAVRWPSV